MNPLDTGQIRSTIEALADALQTAVILAAKLNDDLRSDGLIASQLSDAVARATSALQRMQPTGDAR